MKKFITTLLIGLMLLTMVSCSSEEISMYSLMSEMSRLDIVESSNIISVSLDQESIAETLESIPPELEELKKTFASGFEIKYTSKLKKKTLEYEVAIELKNKGEKEFRKVTTVIGNGTTTYIKLDDLLEFVKPYAVWNDPVIEKTIDDIITKVGYVKIDLNDLKYDPYSSYETYDFNSDDESYEAYNPYDSDYLSEKLTSEKEIKLIDEFLDTIKDAYKDFSFEIITKKGNGYELELKPKDIKAIYLKIVKYTTENIDQIASKLTDKVNSMDDEQMKTLSEVYGAEIQKEEVVSGIEDFKAQVKETTSEEIEEIENDTTFDEDLKNIEGSYLKYYVGKTGEGCYESISDLFIQYEDEYSSKISANITISSETKALADFKLVEPLKFTTVEELKDIVYSTVPVKAKKVKVNLNTEDADIKYNNGEEENIEMQYINKEGYNYLPLRKIGETLGEEVKWDDAKKEAYVVVDGERIVMNGLNKDGRTYVKVRDFEKLGYYIDWNGETKEVMIEKGSQYPALDYLAYYK